MIHLVRRFSRSRLAADLVDRLWLLAGPAAACVIFCLYDWLR